MQRIAIGKPEILTLAAVLLPVLILGCGSGAGNGMPLTCQAARRTFVSAVTAEGVVEAQRSHSILPPRVRGQSQMEIAYLAKEGVYLKAGDIVVEFSADNVRGQLDQALRNLETARSELKKQEAEHASKIAQLEAQITKAEAQQQSKSLKLVELDFVAPRERQIRELEIERAGIEAAKSRNKLESILEVHEKERAQQLLKIKQEESACALARSNLELFVLRTPVDGYVQLGWNRLTDDQVKPGDNILYGWPWPIATIPDISSMQVKLQLSETAVQNMAVGQKAKIEVESLGDLKLTGEISQVAQVAKPIRRNSSVKTVETVVAIDSVAPGLVPGLTASCTLVKEQVDNAIVVPLETVFDRDSTKIVYALAGERFEVREVVLGARGADFVVVTQGLQGNERLALAEPDKSLLEPESYSLLEK